MEKSEKSMPFNTDQILALRTVIREEISSELRPFREEMLQRFDQVAGQIDGLYLRDEKREHEYLALRNQVSQLEESCRQSGS